MSRADERRSGESFETCAIEVPPQLKRKERVMGVLWALCTKSQGIVPL
jgi:hypothetical protein